MESINKIPNIANNTVFLCNNSCYLNTDGLNSNSESSVQFTIPNINSKMLAPSLHINNKENKLFIKFNDVNMREAMYYFTQLSFNKDKENKLYLSMIFNNSSKREIILKIELKKTNKVINTNLNNLLTKAFNNSTSSFTINTILNLHSFLPTNNSFYFTTITPDILMILFENSILINEINYNKLIENIQTIASTNDVITSPLFYNEGSDPQSSQICTTTNEAISNIIKKNKSTEDKSTEDKPKEDKPKEDKPTEDKPKEKVNNTKTGGKILNIIALCIALIVTIVSIITFVYKYIQNFSNRYYLILPIVFVFFSIINIIFTSKNINNKENKHKIMIIIILIFNILSLIISFIISLILNRNHEDSHIQMNGGNNFTIKPLIITHNNINKILKKYTSPQKIKLFKKLYHQFNTLLDN